MEGKETSNNSGVAEVMFAGKDFGHEETVG